MSDDKLKFWSVALLTAYVGKAIHSGAGFPDALVMLGLIAIYFVDFVKPKFSSLNKLESELVKTKEELESLKTHVQGLRIATQLQRRAQ